MYLPCSLNPLSLLPRVHNILRKSIEIQCFIYNPWGVQDPCSDIHNSDFAL